MGLAGFVRFFWVGAARKRIRVKIVLRNLDICFLSAFLKKALIPRPYFFKRGHFDFLPQLNRFISIRFEAFFVTKSDNICQNSRGAKFLYEYNQLK
jgi:hypothetical protein